MPKILDRKSTCTPPSRAGRNQSLDLCQHMRMHVWPLHSRSYSCMQLMAWSGWICS